MLCWVRAARRRRLFHIAIAVLRIAIGFAFVPAGFKKLLGEPFTDPSNVGPFHEFLHALLATGSFYRFIGCVQLFAAVLMMTQVYALVGTFIAFPVLVAIAVFCWSTAAFPTASVVTLMLCGTCGLLLWDYERWRFVFTPSRASMAELELPQQMLVQRVWIGCGMLVFATYGALCVAVGGIYRPRRVDPSDPAFYVMPAIALMPLAAWLIDRKLLRQTR